MYFVPPVVKKEGGATSAEVELAYWNSIANSNNPADFESYLSQYPAGRFAGLAQNKLAVAKGGPGGRGESRRAGDESSGTASYAPAATVAPPPPPTKLAMTKPSGGVFSSGGFSFSDGDGTVKAAEFLSIACRDAIRNKRVRLDVTDKGGSGAPFKAALNQKLQTIGVRVAAAGGAADLIMKGVIETSAGVNRTLRIDEVELDADFSLRLASGKTVSTASVSGGAYSDRNTKRAVRDVWDEKSEEIVGKLFEAYCAGH
jgi:hypothetical protein